jgi:hypothetical protein
MFVARLFVSAILLAFMTLPPTASADPFEDGVSAFERGDYDAALRIWRPLAEHDPRAALNLGVMYAEGLGVQKDAIEALRWLGPAALVGEPNAQMHLGIMFTEGIGGRRPNYEAAAAWYRAAAEQGYPDAQVLLAFAYSMGAGVPQDDVAAHMWVSLAAAKLPHSIRRIRNIAALQLHRICGAEQCSDGLIAASVSLTRGQFGSRIHGRRPSAYRAIADAPLQCSEGQGSAELPTSGEPPRTTAVEPSQSSSLGDASCPTPDLSPFSACWPVTPVSL